METLGRHFLLDLKECSSELLNNLDFVKQVLYSAADEAGSPVVGESFHAFQPQGLSGVVLINGAHLCIHTWPEYAYAAIDIFVHGDSFEPGDVAGSIIEKLESKNPAMVELKRGV